MDENRRAVSGADKEAGAGLGKSDGRGDSAGKNKPAAKNKSAGKDKRAAKEVSRRGWLRGLLPMAVEAAQVAAPLFRDGGPTRPPGALGESDFLALCSRCGDCAQACPYGTVFVFDQYQDALAGTPVMFVEQRPCRQCTDYPCAAACKTGALRMPEGVQPRLGGARIVESRCLPFSGPECGACAGLCPGPKALTLRAGRPQIDGDLCTGCGMCIAACPTSPPAIDATV